MKRCVNCANYDDDLARVLGQTGCKLWQACWWDDEGIMHPKLEGCFKERKESRP